MENRRRASRWHSSRPRHKAPYLSEMNPGMPLDTALENRRRACNAAKFVIFTQLSVRMPLDTTSEFRRRASRRSSKLLPHKTPFLAKLTSECRWKTDAKRRGVRKTPYLAYVSFGMPQNTLQNRHQPSRRLTSRRQLQNVN
jgi:hypothetical protein